MPRTYAMKPSDVPADWHGSVDQAAHLVSDLTGEVIHPRTLRDYVSRGILERPKRGREGGYGRLQILQAVAARRLVRDGWPVSKVPDILEGLSESQLEQQADPPDTEAPVENPALETAAKLRERSAAKDRGKNRKTDRPGAMTDRPDSGPTLFDEPGAVGSGSRPPRKAAPKTVRAYEPNSWLRVEVEAQPGSLSRKELDRAVRDVRRFLKREFLENESGDDNER